MANEENRNGEEYLNRRKLTDTEAAQVAGGSGYAVDTRYCNGCGNCVRACPLGAIKIRSGVAHISFSECLECGTCCNVCPSGAIMPS